MYSSSLIREPIVAHRGERGNYNPVLEQEEVICIVAHRGERGNYNYLLPFLSYKNIVAHRDERLQGFFWGK